MVAEKETEFVVEFIQQVTNLGTISTVSATEEVMSSSEFSRELMSDFEFPGKRILEENTSWKKFYQYWHPPFLIFGVRKNYSTSIDLVHDQSLN